MITAGHPCCEHCTHSGPFDHIVPCRICYGRGPASFRLYDTLNCCAVAVDEAEHGRAAAAVTAWLAARDAASAMAAPDSALAHALGLVLAAAGPSRAGEPWRPELWRVLEAASLACLITADDRETAGTALLDASGHAAGLPCAPAVRVVLTAIWDEGGGAGAPVTMADLTPGTRVRHVTWGDTGTIRAAGEVTEVRWDGLAGEIAVSPGGPVSPSDLEILGNEAAR
jgi:hypothetical protein